MTANTPTPDEAEMRRRAMRFCELIDAWNALSPTDRACYTLMARWYIARPAWLRWLDRPLHFVLFPHLALS